MIKRLINKLRGTPIRGGVRIISRDSHSLSRQQISNSALKIISRLLDAGFDAYLVGGGVRDLLLGGRPKDFDVATDATPEQVKHLFRGSRIIGRRFQIVHVRMGRDMIEVTTFRGQHDSDSSDKHAARSAHGILLRDNVYGDVQSDALRRDFTVNALYYTTRDFAVYDYTDGMNDLAQRKIRMIGDPVTRYKEDPVRILRAIRFAAKLDFTIEKQTARPITEMAELLTHIPSARLFEEVLKLFMGGYAKPTLQLLRQYQVLEHLFPLTEPILSEDPIALALIEQAMTNTDHRIHHEQRVTPAFILAALLWPPLARRQLELQAQGEHPAKAHQIAAQEVLIAQIHRTAITKRFQQTMREIWELQGRLPFRQGNRAERLFEHPRFRAAYDFVLLREQAGEELGGLGQWWTDYQETDVAGREAMVNALTKSGRGPSQRRRRGPRRTPTQNAE